MNVDVFVMQKHERMSAEVRASECGFAHWVKVKIPESLDSLTVFVPSRGIAERLAAGINAAWQEEHERNARLRAKRLRKIDPRDPDYSRQGIFIHHNCSRCRDGSQACVRGNPSHCEYPHARND